jgi:aminopeptidase
MDPREKKLANTLVNYSIKVKPGDWVVVRGNAVGHSMLNEVVRAVLEAGGHPSVFLSTDDLSETAFKYASEEQLKWVSPINELIYNQADALISIRGAENTRALTGIDPKKQSVSALAHQEIQQIFHTRSAAGNLRWVLAQYPCNSFAQEADMSLSDYADFIYSATFTDRDDPANEWQAFHERQERLIEWLHGKDQVVVRGPNVDLTLSVKGRKFINADGQKNMPDGEIFTGPVENSVDGWVRFTYPAIRGGVEVEGVELKFKDGRVIDARAEKNEAYLLSQLDTDEGARYLGEFAIGTNYGIDRFTKNILFDEKIGGTFHLAVGNGYQETGSQNKSAIHWDFICDIRQDSEILVDGERFYQNGAFTVA